MTDYSNAERWEGAADLMEDEFTFAPKTVPDANKIEKLKEGKGGLHTFGTTDKWITNNCKAASSLLRIAPARRKLHAHY
jgi:hypothetical protein